MATKTVLAIGIDPVFTDRSEFPELSPELIHHYIDAQIEQLRTLGYQAESCLIDLGQTAEAAVERALQSRSFDTQSQHHAQWRIIHGCRCDAARFLFPVARN